MAKISQRFLVLSALPLVVAIAAGPGARFYADDPLARMPPPVDAKSPQAYKINPLYDFIVDSVATPGVPKKGKEGDANKPSEGVNTLGEVPDSAWYTNRHAVRTMSLEELKRGPVQGHEPVLPLRVIGLKNEGVTPGFTVLDAKDQRYILKFDPHSNPEMASAADVIGSKFFYAIGYNVPENYIVSFSMKDLQLDAKSKISTAIGKTRPMNQQDLRRAMVKVPRTREGLYRGMASLFLPGKPLGTFEYYGTRSDDPNDLVPHQLRRDLRGLSVFAAWLNHTDAKSGNTFDTLLEEGGVHFIRHYLIDFGATLGSDSDEAKNPSFGHEYMLERRRGALLRMFSLGLMIPSWETADFPHIPAVGNFEAAKFDPENWKSNYPNPAFIARRPDDAFWAAKQVMAFTDQEIRAMVEQGQFSDPRATEYVTATLIKRRDKVGRAFFARVLPLDRFAVREGALAFEDLGVRYGFHEKRGYQVQWHRFDNDKRTRTALPEETTVRIPREADQAPVNSYWAAEITAGDPSKSVTVYIRKAGSGFQVVGIERSFS